MTMVVIRVLVWMAMMALAGVWPCTVHGLGGSLLGYVPRSFFGRIQSDGKRVRLDNQLCLHFSRVPVGSIRVSPQLGEVLQQVFLPLLLRLILIGAVGGLLGLVEELVEDSEVDA